MAKDIKVRFKGEDKGAISTTKKVKGELGGLDKTVKKSSASMLKAGVAIGVAVVALRTMNRVMNDLQEAYYKQEAAVTKLEAALKATNNALGMSSTELQGFASELSRVTAIADEDIIATEALMVTFTKIGRDVFPTAIKAAADMSVMFGQDLQQSAIQLGTALNDPIAGVGRLRRIGIAFTEEQKSMIASFMEVNDLAGAQGVILNELSAEFGGVAEAMGQTAQAAAIGLKNAIGDLKEQMGRTIAVGMKPFRQWLTNIFTEATKVERAINDVQESMIEPISPSNFLERLEQVRTAIAILEEKLKGKIKVPFDPQVKLLKALRAELVSIGMQYDILSMQKGELDAKTAKAAKALREELALREALEAGLIGYNSALEKTLTADEKKRREYELVIKGMQDYINILPRTTAEEEEHFQAVAALRDIYREWLKEIGKVEEKLASLLPQAGSPPIAGATGGGAQMLLGPWPTQMREWEEGIDNIKTAWNEITETIYTSIEAFYSWGEAARDIGDIMINSVVAGMQLIGAAIAGAAVTWTDFKDLALDAFAAVLIAIGKQMAVMAITYALTLRFVAAGLATAASIAAFAAGAYLQSQTTAATEDGTFEGIGGVGGYTFDDGVSPVANLGSTTTIQRQPDIYIYVNFNDAVIGPMGWEQAGADIAEALKRHVGIGGLVHIEEGLAPVGG